jgi:hypothetical protein
MLRAPESLGRTRLAWTVDVLPDELAGPIGEKMDIGIEALRKAWESQAAASPLKRLRRTGADERRFLAVPRAYPRPRD